MLSGHFGRNGRRVRKRAVVALCIVSENANQTRLEILATENRIRNGTAIKEIASGLVFT